MQPAEVQLASGVTASIAGKSVASSTSVSISPSTLSIDINNKDAIAFSYEFTFNADKNDLTRVTVGGTNLRQGTDYNLLSDKNGIRIYKTYLSTLTAGTYTAELKLRGRHQGRHRHRRRQLRAERGQPLAGHVRQVREFGELRRRHRNAQPAGRHPAQTRSSSAARCWSAARTTTTTPPRAR